MDAKQALAERLKTANNILVTVSSNPSVDQLASCIGLTLALNKLNKHAAAVFSGQVPSTIEFLQPEKTIEKNTDSLRDFIISLDKSKADKLRYKVEDKVVKIFITPYRTSINEKDFEFSQGDFNVDVVIALGVHNQADLDQAITTHGRILHDAAVATINNKPGGELGTINWLEPKASSLSELVTELIVDSLQKDLLDVQIATALLTGIVAETERFSNDKTAPATMTLSADLMAAGANQQLVATKLEPPPPPPPAPLPTPRPAEVPKAPTEEPIKTLPTEPSKVENGTLEISHNTDLSALEEPQEEPTEPPLAQINIDEQGSLHNLRDIPEEPPQRAPSPSPLTPEPTESPTPQGNIDPTKHMAMQHMILQPPSMGGQLTASVLPEEDEEKPAGDPLSVGPNGASGLLQRSEPFLSPAGAATATPTFPASDNPYPSPFDPSVPTPASSAPQQPVVVTPTVTPPSPATPSPAAHTPPVPGQTLSEIEQNVRSPHLQTTTSNAATDIDSARNAVMQAIAAQPSIQPEPIQALNAQPLGTPLHSDPGVITPTLPTPPDNGVAPPPPVPPPMLPPQQPA